MRGVTVEQLRRWVEDSKSADGRRLLLEQGAVQASARGVLCAFITWHEDPSCPSAHEELLLSLRLLRNCCAAGRAAAACLMRCGLQCVVPAVAAELQTHLKQQPDAPSLRRTELRQLLLSCVQLLANFSVASGAAAEALWHECFPLIHEQLTDTHDVGVQAAVTLSMLSACKASPEAAQQLTEPRAQRIWLQLLHPLMAPLETPNNAADSPSAPAGRYPLAAASSCAKQQQGHGEAAASSLGNDCLGLLVKAVAVRQGRLEPLLRCLQGQPAGEQEAEASGAEASKAVGGSGGGLGSGWRWNAVHAAVLHLLAHEVASASGEKGESSAPAGAAGSSSGAKAAANGGVAAAGAAGVARSWAGAALAVVCDAAGDVHAWQRLGALEGGRSIPEAQAVVHMLQAAMQLLRCLVQREDGGALLCGGADAVVLLMGEGGAAAAPAGDAQCPADGDHKAEGKTGSCPAAARKGTLVDVMLALLAALGPPINPRRPDAQQHAQLREEHLRLLPEAARARAAARAPAWSPYAGYRADVLCVLSNALHARPAAQRAAAAAGAAELLLSSTQLDEAAPLAREWALWGVRNLCAGAGGEEARERMAALQLQEVVETPELGRMGLKVEVDARGKLNVVSQRA